MSMQGRIALFALFLAAVVGCGDKKGGPAGGQKRIVFLNNTNSPFWDACRAGMVEAEKELNLGDIGLTTVMEVNDDTTGGQINFLRQFGTQRDIIGVAISPVVADNPAIAAELKKLREKGIHVICVDNDLAEDYRDAREYYIGTDNVKGGKQLAICAKTLRPEGGQYVQFVGRTGAQNAKERMDGFKEGVGEGFQEMARMEDEAKRAKARDNVRDAMTNFPELKMLVGIWSYNAPALVDVVKEKERSDLTVVAFDAEQGAVAGMAEGRIHALVVQNPFDMGYQMVKLLKALHEKDEKTVQAMFPNEDVQGGDTYETGLKVVIPNDNSPLKDAKFDKVVEVLTVDQFKEWLAKYNLKSS